MCVYRCKEGARRLWLGDICSFVILAEWFGNYYHWRARSHVQGSAAEKSAAKGTMPCPRRTSVSALTADKLNGCVFSLKR